MQIAASWLYSPIMDFLQTLKPSQKRLWLVAFILLGFLLLGEVYNALIPPFEGPDEAQHFAYVAWLATHRELPPQGEEAWQTEMEQEASQPPFYYFLASLPVRFANLTDVERGYLPNPHYPPPLPHPLPDNENRAIHYLNTATDADGMRGVYVARGVTRLFGLLLLVGVYGLGRQVLREEPRLAVGAMFLTAVIPQIIFLSTMVSNDIPAAALSTMTLWLFAVLLRRDGKRPFFLLSLSIGIFLGLAGLTKVSTLGLLVPLAGGLVWMRASDRWSIKRMVLAGLGLGIGTTAVSTWWFVHNWLHYGSPVGLDTHEYAPWSLSNDGVLAGFGDRWLEIVRSYWIALGWGALRPADWAYTLLSVLGALAVVGLLIFFVKAWQTRRQTDMLTLALLGILIGTVFIMSVLLEYWMRQVVAVHGRLLFPAVGAISLLLVLGWQRLHPKLPWVGYGYSLAWALAVPLLFLQPAYSPASLSETEAANLQSVLGWQMVEDDTPILELKQVNLEATTAVVGDLLPVELCWGALAETETDYSFLVQIIGPENSLVASRRTYPGHGLIPTSDWLVGTAVCETTHVPIPETLSKTLRYQVETALIDNETGRRLAVLNAENMPIDPPFSAQIRIEAADIAYAELVSDAPVQLIASDFAPRWTSGAQETVTLSWAVPAALTTDYQLFVHLRDEAGNVVAQADGPPLAGWYPTSQWTTGEIVTDVRIFPVPTELVTGSYTLVVGFYDSVSGERLGSEQTLGQVEVEHLGDGG